MEAPVAEIKPSIKKAFILNIMIISGVVLLIIVLLIILESLVGLDLFLDVFKEMGLNVSVTSLLLYSIFITIFITVLLLIMNYVSLGKVRYTLYPDKIVYSKSLFILQIHDKEIPYQNITKITYEKKPFLKTSKVCFELTGMKENKITIDFIDNAEEVVQKIQELIREYRAKYYARYSNEYKYQNIMDKF